MKRYQIILLRVGAMCLCLALIFGVTVLTLSGYVKGCAIDRILSPEEARTLSDVDCILVLGCLVRKSGEPSDMLNDRIMTGVALYEAGVSPKILMSGDHGREDYDEVSTMKRVAAEAGVPTEDIFLDHSGFSTYESVVRAKEIFGAKKIVIVTQEYHLYRALYLAEKLGLDAYGVSADLRSYGGQWKRDLREVLARAKDVLYALTKPAPTYLGEPVSLNGSGDVTAG